MQFPGSINPPLKHVIVAAKGILCVWIAKASQVRRRVVLLVAFAILASRFSIAISCQLRCPFSCSIHFKFLRFQFPF